MNPLLTISDLMQVLQVSRKTVTRLVNEGKLIQYDIPDPRFKEEEVKQYIDSKKKITPQEFALQYIYGKNRIA